MIHEDECPEPRTRWLWLLIGTTWVSLAAVGVLDLMTRLFR